MFGFWELVIIALLLGVPVAITGLVILLTWRANARRRRPPPLPGDAD